MKIFRLLILPFLLATTQVRPSNHNAAIVIGVKTGLACLADDLSNLSPALDKRLMPCVIAGNWGSNALRRMEEVNRLEKTGDDSYLQEAAWASSWASYVMGLQALVGTAIVLNWIKTTFSTHI